jgi:ribosomal-protein-alanine N-acetyltransferase
MLPFRRPTGAAGQPAIRPAVPADEPRMLHLLDDAAWRHQHLDWISPLQFLGERPFFGAFDGENMVACFGCPPERPGVAWIRLFAATRQVGLSEAWSWLWEAAQPEARHCGIRKVAALSARSWMTRLLRQAGFTSQDEVVFLERKGPPPARHPLSFGRIRPATAADLSPIAELDWRAFPLPWQLSLRSLEAAMQQATLSTVVEVEGRIVAYQLTTFSPHSFHLSRLATQPELKGRGLSRALTTDAMGSVGDSPRQVWSVNTQSGNTAALGLYRSLGFQETGLRYPVYALDL